MKEALLPALPQLVIQRTLICIDWLCKHGSSWAGLRKMASSAEI